MTPSPTSIGEPMPAIARGWRNCCWLAAARVDARLAAIGLTAVVDGLWLELCLDPTVFTPAEAGAIAERLLAGYSPALP
jgi:hypothetical protein